MVVLCVALELSIRITVIPFTPLAALAPWAVTAYGPAGADGVIYVGNNDVHYVYLSRGQWRRDIRAKLGLTTEQLRT